MKSAIIIPALNEAAVIESVVLSVIDRVDLVVVADNGSTDGTGGLAEAAGAKVVYVETAGYGRACLAGVAASEAAELLIFMDGDGADDPNDIAALIAPIIAGELDLVIGSRMIGHREEESMTPVQVFGNRLASTMMSWFWDSPFTDLGPLRAVRRSAYDKLNMTAPTFGWTVEMQVRALKQKLRCGEVPVSYKKRVGISKISGTLRGAALAGYFIIGTILIEAISRNRGRYSAS